MARNLSPALRQELAKLDLDGDSRRSAMKALKEYVKGMDSKAIPSFLAQVSETKDAGASTGEYAISIYENLARVHGPNIVPQLDNIMSSIIKTLTTSGGSFPLQQACSKVVPAIAKYGIETNTPEEKKRLLIHSLCKPLSDALLGSQESLSCGAALCLKALVDCGNWRFASDEMVNEVCLKLASALEDKMTQTNSHMGLVMSLAKRNSLTVEAYARLLIRAGLNILNCGLSEKNSQKRFTAIQMVHSLMKCLDIRSIISELDSIIEEMEKCQSDQMPYVKGAAFEALQTAKRLLAEKGSKINFDEVSVTGSNFSKSSNSRRSQSPRSASPESQTLDSFAKTSIDSPFSTSQASCNVNHNRKSLHRKRWNPENGYVNVSLKDGIFSDLAGESYGSHASSEQYRGSDGRRSYANGFPGFTPGGPAIKAVKSRSQSPVNGARITQPPSPANRSMRSQTPSPQRTRSQINVDNVRIFTTPRKLVRSLQDNEDLDYFNSRLRRNRSPCSANCGWSPVAKYNEDVNKEKSKDGSDNMTDGVKDCGCSSNSESVSSTEDVLATTIGDVPSKLFRVVQPKSERTEKPSAWKICTLLLFILLMVSVGLASLLLSSEQNEVLQIVPT